MDLNDLDDFYNFTPVEIYKFLLSYDFFDPKLYKTSFQVDAAPEYKLKKHDNMMCHWCFKNIKNKWYSLYFGEFWFENKNDALLFKMKFG
jgi:hypothetical protein